MKTTTPETRQTAVDLDELHQLLAEAISLFPPQSEIDNRDYKSLKSQLAHIQRQVMSLQRGNGLKL